MAKGPTVTLTFAGDAKGLRNTTREVETVTQSLNRGITGLGVGFAAMQGLAASAPLVAAGAMGALAVGVAGIGIAAAAQSEKVKKSFTDLKTHVVDEVKKMAQPFEPVLLNISDRARAMFTRISPMLTDMFKTAAPYVSTLAGGVIGFVENALPGMKAGLEVAKPVVDAIANGIRGAGSAIGEFFVNISGGKEGAQGAADAVKSLFEWVNWLIPKIGTAINFLMTWGPTLLPLAGFIYGIVAALKIWNTVQGIFNLVMMANPISLVVLAIIALVAIIIYAWNNCETFREVVKGVWEAVKNAFSSGVEKAKALLSWFKELPGRASEWFGGMKDRATAKLTELVGWVRGLPGRILGALGNLGSLLLESGRALLQGLWDGISGKVQWLKDRVSGVLKSIRNLFPFSPAKEGPFSGSGYTTHSGKAMMEDWGKGAASVDLRPIFSRPLGTAQGAMNGATPGGSNGGGALMMQVSGNADSALVSLLHALQRRGDLQFVRA